jgi:aryl-alcohol dehydrogenase-like predicted oxidoreductase
MLNTIAKKHGVSITNVATRYILEKPQVAGVIIGARNANHLDNNTTVFSFVLESEDIKKIESVLAKAKGPNGDIYGLERIKGGKHAGIMKYNLNKE